MEHGTMIATFLVFYVRKNGCFARLVDGVVKSYDKVDDFDSINKV
jgi:hypothetical protein